ncbi:class II glutamine amidotransferase [Amnibacterium endophyticum]|uniref:Class II glutamine amidotransferase n=1 Tax=Amnibacterium endophyticum TaxID=2109337 RepID=A0ABW4LBT0_9MICO
MVSCRSARAGRRPRGCGWSCGGDPRASPAAIRRWSRPEGPRIRGRTTDAIHESTRIRPPRGRRIRAGLHGRSVTSRCAPVPDPGTPGVAWPAKSPASTWPLVPVRDAGGAVCRLLGSVSPAPATVEAVLGAGQRRVFVDMARLHRDGWGTAWRDEAGTVRRRSRSATAVGDPELEDLLAGGPSTARIVHLRLATDGFACVPENTHPFLADGMAFAHNGSLEPTGPIERLIGAEQRAGIVGTTDTERYFAAVRTLVARGAEPLDALLDTVAALRRIYPQRSLNALLLTSDELLAVHASEGVPIPWNVFAASGIPAERLPAHHADAYYLMRSRRGEDGSILFASSGLDIAGWEPLPAESITRVDLRTLHAETVPLAQAARRREVA